jgi:hypothetical protein
MKLRNLLLALGLSSALAFSVAAAQKGTATKPTAVPVKAASGTTKPKAKMVPVKHHPKAKAKVKAKPKLHGRHLAKGHAKAGIPNKKGK